jgi:3-hydroxymyristoyl/3-hydroxydecanoyl-(acyl carrier protein) dehydratase
MEIGRTEPEIIDVRTAPNRCELDLVIPMDLGYFTGHFDGFPILPGVVQLHWSLQLARRYLALGAGTPATIQVKFRKPIQPGARLVLTLTRETVGGREQLAFDYRGDGEPCSSGRIVLADP